MARRHDAKKNIEGESRKKNIFVGYSRWMLPQKKDRVFHRQRSFPARARADGCAFRPISILTRLRTRNYSTVRCPTCLRKNTGSRQWFHQKVVNGMQTAGDIRKHSPPTRQATIPPRSNSIHDLGKAQEKASSHH